MKGVMFTGKGVTEIVDEFRPQIKQDEVLIETLYSGISNGTERSFLVGGSYGGQVWPNRIGYQTVARIIECGKMTKKFNVGDIVFYGKCTAHVEYEAVKEDDLIIKLPENFNLIESALLGVASVSFCDCRMINISPDDKVMVFGTGLIGQFAAQCAILRGADVVLAGGGKKEREKAAKDAGIHKVYNNKKPKDQKKIFDEGPFDAVMECSGADILDQIIGTNKDTGLIAQKARLFLTAGRFDVNYFFNAAGAKKLTIHHSTHFQQNDLGTVIRLVGEGKLKIKPYIKEVVSIDEAVKYYDLLRDDTSNLFGTVFDWNKI